MHIHVGNHYNHNGHPAHDDAQLHVVQEDQEGAREQAENLVEQPELGHHP